MKNKHQRQNMKNHKYVSSSLAQCSTSQTLKPIPLIKRSKGTSLVTLGGGTSEKNQHGHLRNMWKVVEFNQTPKIV